MLTVADRGRGVKFAKILLTSYVNASLLDVLYCYDVCTPVLVSLVCLDMISI